LMLVTAVEACAPKATPRAVTRWKWVESVIESMYVVCPPKTTVTPWPMLVVARVAPARVRVALLLASTSITGDPPERRLPVSKGHIE